MLLNTLKKRNMKMLSTVMACVCALSACGQTAPAVIEEPAVEESIISDETSADESAASDKASIDEAIICDETAASEDTSAEESVTFEDSTDEAATLTTLTEDDVPCTALNASGLRDSTPVCFTPSASGVTVYSNALASIDASNVSEGYIMVNYTGSNPKVKLQITGSNGVTYTYNLHGGYETFPLSAGSGSYKVAVYENVTGNQYATAMSQTINANITNAFGPYLYPNQYVNFDASSKVVSKAQQLAEGCATDLDVVAKVYNYTTTISYDYAKANSVQSGYTPNVDQIMQNGTGICLDYAAVMASMLRSQNIPTRLEVGYVGTAYHAWISTYITDIGWVNGVIEFNGTSWSLMDPTFAANTSDTTLKDFIGNGSNYKTKYIY